MRRKVNGRSNWERIGPYPGMTVEQARNKADEINGVIAQGHSPFEQRKAWDEELTLGELFQEYLVRHARKKRKTADRMEKEFARYLNHWREHKLSTITHNDVERLHGYLGRAHGIYVANRTIQLLRAIYNKGRTRKLFLQDNPAAGISLFPERARERFLNKDEVKRLLHALLTEADHQIRDFVMLSLLTGARKSNIVSMRWQDIDLDSGVWTIPETKNGTSQTIALTAIEIAILARRHTTIDGDYVFPGRGPKGHLVELKKAWYRLLARADIKDCTLHDLRRNLGSWMASQNVNVALIQSALNHKDLKTTLSVYARTAKDAERKGREVAHSAMFQAAGIVLALPNPDGN
ncbi:MAG TPA: tyrosine-type recombinase/integrase [Candidatus Obscuribacterales bacterium]